MKEKISTSSLFKQDAINILAITKNEPIYLYSKSGTFDHHKPGRFYITGCYLEMLGEQIVQTTETIKDTGFSILAKEELNSQEILYTIDNRKNCLYLVKN